MVAAGAGSARLTPASLRLSLAYARFRQRLCLPWLRSFARFRSEVLRLRLRKKKRYFREKRAFRGTHIFPENGMLGFCSASAPQKQDLQKSTLHNTQLWDIFNPSAFGYGKCPITCVMYKPLRLWLRGSTFLQNSLRPTALSGVRPAAGVGKKANDRFSASAFGWVALVGFASLAPWFWVYVSAFAPTMSEKKIAKGFAFHNFFSDKLHILQQIILFLRYK